MAIVNPQHSISLNSYSKSGWESILKETAYRGLNIHKIATRMENAQECTFDDDRLIRLITSKGKTITVDMNEVFKNRDRWTLSRLVHNIRMHFPKSEYAAGFNTRIAKLAERLALDARPKHFHKRCQENLGDFAILPSEIRDQIIYSMPLACDEDLRKCIEYLKWFCKAPLGEIAIFRTGVSKHGTVDVKKLAHWLNEEEGVFLKLLSLCTKDQKTLFPYLGKLHTFPSSFDFTHFDLIGTCKNLKFLTVSGFKDFRDDHCMHIAKLSNLTVLKIFNCPNFSNEGMKHFSALYKLTQLVLINCKVTGDGLYHIEKLSNLKRLILDNCNLREDDTFDHLLPLINLKSLAIREPNLTQEGYKRLGKLSSLKTILIEDGSFRDEDFETIGKMTNLKGISILNQHLTGSGLKYLNNLDKLLSLYLDQCINITDENFQHVFQIKNFCLINISGCWQISEKTIQQAPKHIIIEIHNPAL